MIFLFGICISFFLVLLLIGKKGKKLADYVLAIWLFVMGLHISFYYIFSHDIQTTYPHLFGLAIPFPLLHGPLLFLYTMALTRPVYFQAKNWIWHFIPALCMYIYLIPFLNLPASEKIKIIENKGAGYETFGMVSVVLFNLSGIVYILWSYFLLRAHKKTIAQNFSNTEKINLEWLQYLIFFLSIIWLMVLFGEDNLIFDVASITVLCIGYFGIKQVGIFTNIHGELPEKMPENSDKMTEEPVSNDTSPDTTKKKYQKSGLSEEQSLQLQKQLEQLMKTEKTFTNPELTLVDLATKLGVHTNYLSQVINERIGVSFYDYINTLRIEEFKKRVILPESKAYTLLSIAYDCGFNSKSSFNRYFKKVNDISPSEYVKERP